MSISDNIKNKQVKIIKSYTKYLNSENKALAGLYAKASDNVNKSITKLYISLPELTQTELKRGQLLEEAEKHNRLDKTLNIIKDDIKEMNGLINEEIAIAVFTAYGLGKFGSGWAIETSTGLNGGIGLNKITQKELNGIKFSDKYKKTWTARNATNNEKLFNIIESELTQGLNEGRSLVKTGRLIRDKFLKFQVVNKKTRVSGGLADAIKIARTETHRALNEGKWFTSQAAKKMANKRGFELKRQIISIRDGREREQSAIVDGRFENKNGYFEYPGGIFVQVPGNSGIAKWDINDREQWADVIFDKDGILDPSPTDNISPQEWGKINNIFKQGQEGLNPGIINLI